MVKFKITISNPKNGRSETVEVEGAKAYPLIGKSIGDTVDGSILGLQFKKLLITGGTDKDGFPMRPDVHGGVKAKILLSGGVGFHPRVEGERRRKTVRGRIITEDIVQINMKVLEE
ncbi:30S ribosomal protein S6e [Candidatus Bathyarchaeota archaeon]|nr:MAG: 30S ribosomal protein S6e [Candidatus Bathyarchaeota archaeon]RLI32063.1 MAG: 30S ribosomal protein S6e [Candidatus Bathyarchaeota archaeon]